METASLAAMREEETRELLLRQGELLQRQQEQRFLDQEARQRALLLEAMRPLAAALQRQDQMAQARSTEEQSLLLEVLSSLQPSAAEQISPLIGQPAQMSSSRSWAS